MEGLIAAVIASFLAGSSLVILHMLREDTKARRVIKQDLAKSAEELQTMLIKMNELHNRSAEAVQSLQDKVQSHAMILGSLRNGK